MEGIEILITGLIAIFIYIVAIKTIKRSTSKFIAVFLIAITQFVIGIEFLSDYNTEMSPFQYYLLANNLFLVLFLVHGIKAIKSSGSGKIKIAIGASLVIVTISALVFFGFTLMGMLWGF